MTVATAYAHYDRARAAYMAASAALATALAADTGTLAPDVPADVATIINTVAAAYVLSPADIYLRRRDAIRAEARHVAMHLCRGLTPHTLKALGRAFRRDHAAVMCGVASIEGRIGTEPALAARVETIKRNATAALATA